MIEADPRQRRVRLSVTGLIEAAAMPVRITAA
jgi:hypothetical protein